MYKCSQCGLSVVIIDGKVIKACKCNAPITAELSTRLAGKGGVKA